MKHSKFGDAICTPGDDPYGVFQDENSPDGDCKLIAKWLEKDPSFGWCCTLVDQHGTELEVQDFKTKAGLTLWLKQSEIDLELEN